MDETYVGGRKRGKRGRGSENKELVIGIRQRQGELLLRRRWRSGTLEKYIRGNISDDVEILMADNLNQYRGVVRRMGMQHKHRAARHGLGIYVQGDVHTNTVESAFSLLKRVFSPRGIESLLSISKPIAMKCASDLTIGKTAICSAIPFSN